MAHQQAGLEVATYASSTVPASVIVCTYHLARVPDLQATLASLEGQTFKAFQLIVVVDHNPELLCHLRSILSPHVQLIENSGTRGLSGARNSGIAAARGRFVAFIDDDATAEPTWLEKLLRPYQSDDVLATGGRIVPAWSGGVKPAWFPDEYLWVVGCTYVGMPAGGPVRNVIGCNMSFRAEVFEQVGGFDDSIGRVGAKPLGCEETELCIRARQRWPKGEVLYVSDAVVHHNVPRARCSIRYFLSRSFSEGVSKALVRRLVGNDAISSETSYALKTLPTALLRHAQAAICLRHPDVAIGQMMALVCGITWAGVGFVYGSTLLLMRSVKRPRQPSVQL